MVLLRTRSAVCIHVNNTLNPIAYLQRSLEPICSHPSSVEGFRVGWLVGLPLGWPKSVWIVAGVSMAQMSTRGALIDDAGGASPVARVRGVRRRLRSLGPGTEVDRCASKRQCHPFLCLCHPHVWHSSNYEGSCQNAGIALSHTRHQCIQTCPRVLHPCLSARRYFCFCFTNVKK